MFGSDSESEEETFKGSAKPAVNETASGLFGSDSESEEDEKPKKLKKAVAKKAASKPPKPAKRKPSRSADDDDDDTPRKPAARRVEGDEYDSGEEVERTKDDEAFIDDEDDLGGVLDEYNQDNQTFDDERPEEEEDRFTRRREAEDFFDETMKSMKSGRGRSKLKMSQQEIETLTQEVLYNMDKAYNDDLVAMDERRPALEKLKLVDKVLLLMRKVQLQQPLLDFDLLGVIKKWIQPMENGSLPNLGLRTKMIEICQRLPIDKEHLKRSGFGKVIMTLWKHPDESVENKEICRQLIDRWSRSVFSKTLDFSKLGELEAEKREANGGMRGPAERRQQASRAMERNRGFLDKQADPADAGNGSERVRIPESIRIDFTMRPQPKIDVSNMPSNKIDPESKKARLMKRMQTIARPTKRAKRAVKMSVEGRGLES
ncbi:Aste57867_22366 [Aphanomyces stellatus]|uniref:Aste57867_22366 protein n=1 Tax=Aphanomyces stellatus TaxID=120398 RepID=A0A485LKM7_9STRA|nr:hypothetical protein As57867_022296 [Aphanomyces stellatus]VFT99029.1 Aste57867_22366 [Aphanomyces stellatus]